MGAGKVRESAPPCVYPEQGDGASRRCIQLPSGYTSRAAAGVVMTQRLLLHLQWLHTDTHTHAGSDIDTDLLRRGGGNTYVYLITLKEI